MSKLALCLNQNLPVFAQDVNALGAKSFFCCGYSFFVDHFYKKKKENLIDLITDLEVRKKKLEVDLKSEKKENEDLTNENSGLKQTVESEQKKSSDLLNKNISLSNKVAVAEILKPTSLIATGIKFRTNGKESATDRVKSLEKINHYRSIYLYPFTTINHYKTVSEYRSIFSIYLYNLLKPLKHTLYA